MGILTKFFGNLMDHIIREYAGKKIKSILCIKEIELKFENTEYRQSNAYR